MTRTFFFAAAVSALTLASATAQAADLGGPIHAPRVIPAPIEVGGGWYLRGDVGVGIQNYDALNFTVGNPAPFGPNPFQGFRMESDHFSDPTIIGLGLGYQFNEWLRFDVTGEYRSASKFGFTLVDRTAPPLIFGNVYSGTISSAVGLANVYFDIGSFMGITPFVGAGIGFASHTVRGFTDTGVFDSAGGFGIAPTQNTVNFARALHAGLSYTVTQSLKLEASYRYLNMGDVGLGTIACFGAPCPNINYTAERMQSHDFRLGMRWMLGAPAPVAVAGPIIARN